MTIIYKYTCRITGKVYIGKTERTLKQRHIEHYNDAFRSMRPFQSAIRKYGMESFDSEILVEVDSNFGDFSEMAFIIALRANDKRYGYNVAIGGKGTPGVKVSAANIARLRELAKTRKSRQYTSQQRQELRKRMIGNTLGVGATRSDEFKQRVGDFHRGKKMSPESIAKRQRSRYGRPTCSD